MILNHEIGVRVPDPEPTLYCMTRKERKEKLLVDLAAFHRKMREGDPNSVMTAEDLAESRRLIREKADLNLTEGEELRAIHGF